MRRVEEHFSTFKGPASHPLHVSYRYSAVANHWSIQQRYQAQLEPRFCWNTHTFGDPAAVAALIGEWQLGIDCVGQCFCVCLPLYIKPCQIWPLQWWQRTCLSICFSVIAYNVAQEARFLSSAHTHTDTRTSEVNSLSCLASRNAPLL